MTHPDASNENSLDQGRADLALSAANMGEFEINLAEDLMIVSPRMAAIMGYPAGSHPARGGAAMYALVHPDDQEAVAAAVAEGRRSRARYQFRFRMTRPDNGRLQWIDCTSVAIRDPAGQPNRIIGVVQDVTERKSAEDQREALVSELDHRVKNVLASVQSLAAQSARKTVSLDAFLKTFAGRLEAMASAHTLLTATRWRGAEINDIAAAELAGLAQGQARWEGPEIVLNPRATNALTLALHELATNAMKYGALSTETGRVDVSWAPRPEGGFVLTWAERDGPPVAPPARRGFGSTLLERVTGRELGGRAELEFRPAGVRASLWADASALAVASPTSPAAVSPAAPAGTAADHAPDIAGGASLGPAAEDIRGVKVLIVEDSVLLALELEAGLTDAGAKVAGTAASLEEAGRMLDLKFDVAVLDANLNGVSVTPIAQALAARGTPFIIATGYGEAGPAPEGFDVPVVRKPYNIGQIAVALAHALGRG